MGRAGVNDAVDVVFYEELFNRLAMLWAQVKTQMFFICATQRKEPFRSGGAIRARFSGTRQTLI